MSSHTTETTGSVSGCPGGCCAVLRTDDGNGESIILENMDCSLYEHDQGEGILVKLIKSDDPERRIAPTQCTVLGWGETCADAIHNGKVYARALCHLHRDGDLQGTVDALGLASQDVSQEPSQATHHIVGFAPGYHAEEEDEEDLPGQLDELQAQQEVHAAATQDDATIVLEEDEEELPGQLDELPPQQEVHAAATQDDATIVLNVCGTNTRFRASSLETMKKIFNWKSDFSDSELGDDD